MDGAAFDHAQLEVVEKRQLHRGSSHGIAFGRFRLTHDRAERNVNQERLG